MAFVIGSVVSPRIPTGRTYLEAVTRVLRATGHGDPGSIYGNIPEHVHRARAAVDDALQRVWNAALWDFRQVYAYLEFEANKFDYALPGDWVARASNVLQLYATAQSHTPYMDIKFISYQRMLRLFPQLRIPYRGQVTEPGVSEATKLVGSITELLGGVPQWFSIVGNSMVFYPVPVANDVHLDPNWDIAQPVLTSYFGGLKDLTANDDVVPLPPNLLVVHHFLALAYYKQAQEAADYKVDEARGEGMLRIEVMKMIQHSGDKALDLRAED